MHHMVEPDSAESSDSDERREEEEEGQGEVEIGDQDAQAVLEEECKCDLEEDVPGDVGREKGRRRRRGLFPFGLMSRSRQGGVDDDNDGGGGGDRNMMDIEPSDQKGDNSTEALAKGGNPKPPKKGGWLKGLFRRSSSNKSTGSADPSPALEEVPMQECREEEAESNEEEGGDTPTLSDFD